ncbi:MAG TPA: GNAT family N-acetyltransferase [Flavitalea sp.]|nr:GNAT family N-acetyltransferase [Flavitalea sp.]
MKFSIRQATPEDYPIVHALIREFAGFQKTPERVTITIADMQGATDIFQCLVAVTDSAEIIGFASYFFAWYSWSGKALYLDDLYIKEKYRRHKAGSLLLEQIIALAKKEHCKKVRWQVSNWNKSAISFYHKLGAVTDDTEINCDLKL